MMSWTNLMITLVLWASFGLHFISCGGVVSQACTMTFLPKIDSTVSNPQVACQGAPQPSVHLTCLSSSCQGTSTCKSCTADLTHAYVSSVECVNYDAGEAGVTTCMSSSNESYTCTGSCSGYASCSSCTLEPTSTPAGPTSTASSSGTKQSGGDGSTNGQVTTWLAWR